MKNTLIFVARLLTLSGLLIAQQPSVREIETLIGAKIADDLIVERVKRSGKPLELTAEDMISLKKAGASDTLIRQLLLAGTPGAVPQPAAAGQPPVQASEPKLEIGVYAKKGPSWLEISSEVVNVKSSGVLKMYTFRMDLNGRISGASSKTTLKSPIEIMLVTAEGVSANEYQLVRLKSKDTVREFRFASSGLGGAKSGVDRDAIAFDFKKLGPGQFTINLPSSVVAGEYAFLPPMGVGGSGMGGGPGASMGKAYTFRVLE